MFLESLPDEISQLIIQELDFQDVYNLQIVNHRFRSLIKKRKLLKIPCSKLWFSYMNQGVIKQESGVLISEENAKLLNLGKRYFTNAHMEHETTIDVIKYWLGRIEVDGSVELSFPIFDDKLFKQFYKHKRQFRKCSRFNFTYIDLQLSQENLTKFLRMSERVDVLNVAECTPTRKLVLLKVLENLNLQNIDISTDDDFSFLDDEFLKKIIFPTSHFYLGMEMKTTFTMKKLMDYLENNLEKDHHWKFGIIPLGATTWINESNRLDEIGKNEDYIVDYWPTDENMNRILIQNEYGTRNLYISFEVDERIRQ